MTASGVHVTQRLHGFQQVLTTNWHGGSIACLAEKSQSISVVVARLKKIDAVVADDIYKTMFLRDSP